MAVEDLTIQQIDRAGITPSLEAANADGYYVSNNGRVFLQVKNGGASSITVTIETPGTVDGMAIADRTVDVLATSGDKMMGPFPSAVYNDVQGRMKVTFSDVTSVTVGGFRL